MKDGPENDVLGSSDVNHSSSSNEEAPARQEEEVIPVPPRPVLPKRQPTNPAPKEVEAAPVPSRPVLSKKRAATSAVPNLCLRRNDSERRRSACGAPTPKEPEAPPPPQIYRANIS